MKRNPHSAKNYQTKKKYVYGHSSLSLPSLIFPSGRHSASKTDALTGKIIFIAVRMLHTSPVLHTNKYNRCKEQQPIILSAEDKLCAENMRVSRGSFRRCGCMMAKSFSMSTLFLVLLLKETLEEKIASGKMKLEDFLISSWLSSILRK